jgi:hypothetical protein
MLQMKNILLVLTAITSANALKVAEGSEGGLTVELMSKWKLWTDAHGKKYESHEKKMERLQVWLDNNGTYLHAYRSLVYIGALKCNWHNKKTALHSAERVSRGRCTGILQVLMLHVTELVARWLGRQWLL